MNVADDALDRAEQHVRQVDRVAHQVGRDAVAALVDQEAPRQQPQRVAAVHREEAPAVVGDVAQAPVCDELRRVANERRPAVVVAHACRHTRLARQALGAGGLLRRPADRLLAEDVLAGLRGGLDQLEVQHVRRRDPHDVNGRIVHDRAPVGGPPRVPEGADGLAQALGDGVAADHELGLERPLGEQGADALQRAAVGLAEPSEADQADADAPARPGLGPTHPRGAGAGGDGAHEAA
jgi:hypothetical protein